jgi:hypothetical protein
LHGKGLAYKEAKEALLEREYRRPCLNEYKGRGKSFFPSPHMEKALLE